MVLTVKDLILPLRLAAIKIEGMDCFSRKSLFYIERTVPDYISAFHGISIVYNWLLK